MRLYQSIQRLLKAQKVVVELFLIVLISNLTHSLHFYLCNRDTQREQEEEADRR